MIKKMLGTSALLFSSLSFASMSLVPDESSLHFISIKQNLVAEISHFDTLSGSVSDDGKVNVAIALDSVQTNIGIRDERMKEFLFQTKQFKEAIFTTSITPKEYEDLKPGQSVLKTIAGELSLHGHSVAVNPEVQIVKLTDDKVSITTVKPLILQAGQFGLVEGVNKLKSLAGLDSISYSVPVTFSVTFQPEK